MGAAFRVPRCHTGGGSFGLPTSRHASHSGEAPSNPHEMPKLLAEGDAVLEVVRSPSGIAWGHEDFAKAVEDHHRPLQVAGPSGEGDGLLEHQHGPRAIPAVVGHVPELVEGEGRLCGQPMGSRHLQRLFQERFYTHIIALFAPGVGNLEQGSKQDAGQVWHVCRGLCASYRVQVEVRPRKLLQKQFETGSGNRLHERWVRSTVFGPRLLRGIPIDLVS
jgi:hypothetical protein